MKYALCCLVGAYLTLLFTVLILAYLYDDLDIRLDNQTWNQAKMKARIQFLEHSEGPLHGVD